ncbi:hypothetical protein Y032_0048g1671 [Ancylostoma ceylanicum]|uniref:Tc1-like transposase DDE domain-containing protein n=1 Tax=Ancylostoma ceylanicum TaxID=53326 RepID=A0A016UAM7_9BILA|nr:hypothetical protein Y032_0048g1671 [Ancylostoma ceylanicum]
MLRRYQISLELLLWHENEPFLDRVVTCDEKWTCTITANDHRSGWTKMSPRNNSRGRSCTERRLCSLFGGILHYVFLEPCETIKEDNYCHQMNKMQENLARASSAVVKRKGPVLLHDTAGPHVSRKTSQKLSDLGYEILPHPAYSPDLSPTNYHFFKHVDNFIRGRVSKNQTDAGNAFSEFIASKTTDFQWNGINYFVKR